MALGADKASNLYKYMEPEDVESLTIEVAKLGLLRRSRCLNGRCLSHRRRLLSPNS